MKNMTYIDMPTSGSLANAVSAVLRLFSIMRLMGEQKVSCLTELSRRAMMPRQTVYRMLQTMQAVGYVTRQGGGEEEYGLSLRLFELGVLADGHHVHSLLGIEAGRALYVSARTGRRISLHGSRLGKVMVAWLGETERRQLLKTVVFVSFTRNTVRDADALLDELVRVRRQGYAKDDEEVEPGLCCVAVPVYDRLGHVIAGLSLPAQGAISSTCAERADPAAAGGGGGQGKRRWGCRIMPGSS